MIETQLIDSLVYNFLDKVRIAPGFSAAMPPTELVTKLNDELKTYLRIKAEAKFIPGETPEAVTYFVSYKDSNKNSHTFYFEL